MIKQTQAVRQMTDEEIKFEKLTAKIEKLEKIVGALAVTNFLTQHEDGDEEVRDQSVEDVNVLAAEYKQRWKTNKEIQALEKQKYEIDEKIERIKWGTLTYKASERYATSLGNAILNTQNTVTANLMNTTIALDLQQEYMNAFNASAARAEAVTVLKEVK